MKYKELKENLIAQGYADDGLVAYGNYIHKTDFGALGAAFGTMYAISKKGDSILFIPFNNKEIFYSKAINFDKRIISHVCLKGWMIKKLIITIDEKKYKFSIIQGITNIRTILQKLGF